jgi:hypothetical protein
MKIIIAGEDYTTALDAALPLTIERKLNEPSICELWLSLPAGSTLPAPARYASLSVIGDDGTIYFTGYIAVAPLPEYAGMALEGPRYRTAIQAVSDELLLDQLLMPPSTGSTGQTASTLMTSLVMHTGSSALSTGGLALSTPVSNFVPELGASWSTSAGQVASDARAAYRALSGELSLQSVPGVIHPLNETDGSLSLQNLSFTASVKRALANDVTVCGEHEPVAYVTEYFLGDGVTTQFYLAADPFFPAASRSNIISELFNEPSIDTTVWTNSGAGGYISLGATGLTITGGSGVDGQTFLSWIDPVEMGGTLLLEAAGVSLSLGSAGALAGFFVGLETQPFCIAGFAVTAQSGTGAVSVQPLIQGSAAGTSYAINPTNQYSLRVRMHCAEVERTLSLYRSFGDGGPITYGGQTTSSAGKLQLEIQEFVDGVAGVPVTLYDGGVASLPAACAVVAASSINLIGTMRAIHLTNLGTGWVVSTPPSGGPYTRRVGTLAEAAECHLERTGKAVFYTGSTPVSGEQIAVSYRTIGRAVGRAVNAASQEALIAAGSPAVAAWIGSVTSPAARSSADCLNAATAIEQAAAGVSALWSGSYLGSRFSFAADVWPGDALGLNAPSTSLNVQVVVRAVKVSYRASYPDFVQYAIQFANDWADDLAIKTSVTVPADAWLPATIAPAYLANLTGLTVTALNGTTVSINTGVTAPAGGGFEVRRRDFAFMPGEDRFYIRMYDDAMPPNYSEFSTALFINLPLGS